MKKFLISLASLMTIFSIIPILTNVTIVDYFSSENVKNIQKNIDLTSNNKELDNDDDYYITYGSNYDTTYRIYIDNSPYGADGYKGLPSVKNGKSKDYIVGASAKKQWREHLVEGLSLDNSTLAANKTEFLKKYQAITATYLYTYNFWNTFDGWTYVGNKAPFEYIEPYTFHLTAGDYSKPIFEASDDSHSNNERARLTINQTWDGNILKINYLLGVLYNWKFGSWYAHASIAQFTNDKYTLVAVPNDGSNRTDVQLGRVRKDGATFTSKVNSNTKIPLLDTIDQALKKQAQESAINNAICLY